VTFNALYSWFSWQTPLNQRQPLNTED